MSDVQAFRSLRATTLAATLVFATSGASFAADLGGNCCADLEERVAELEATTGRKGNRKISLTITGWVTGQLLLQQPVYTVIDPTSFAIEDNALRFIGSDISNMLNGSLNRSIANAPFEPSSQMNLGAGPHDSAATSGAAGAPVAASGVWGSALGGRATTDSKDLSETEAEFGGGIGGGHFRFAPGMVAGAFAGGATNRLETERGKRIDTDYVLAGVYGRIVSGQTFLDASLTGGRSESSSDRGIVTTVPGVPAFQTAHGDYDGTFALPVLRLGVYVPTGNGAVFIPAVQVRYNWQHFDGYEESGSSVNLDVGDRTLQALEERFEIGMQKSIAGAPGESLTLHANAGVVLYQRVGDRDVDVSVFSSPTSFDPGGDDSETGIFGRAGFDWQIAAGVSAFGEAEGIHTKDAEAITGSGGVRVRY